MRILYATDGSQGAVPAGRFLAGLRHQRGVHIHILTVLSADNRGDGEAILTAARETLGAFPGHVTAAVTRADSTSEIVESILFSAAYVKADLIVVGATGHAGIARFLVGSVAEGVVRHADLPVLVARSLSRPLGEVVIGVDGSETARSAACWAAERLPLPDNCVLHLVRALTPPVWVWGSPVCGSSLTELETEGALEQALRDGIITTGAYLEPLAQDLAAPDGPMITTEAAVGNPAHELVRIALEHEAGLIVVGSHGLTGMERFLLGSVSESVVRHADCSVLVVRTTTPKRTPQEKLQNNSDFSDFGRSGL